MFNNLEHQLMCEIEGIENVSNAAIEFCQNEEWESIPECMNMLFKRFKAAFKLCVALQLINPPAKPERAESSEPAQVEVISSETVNAEDADEHRP